MLTSPPLPSRCICACARCARCTRAVGAAVGAAVVLELVLGGSSLLTGADTLQAQLQKPMLDTLAKRAKAQPTMTPPENFSANPWLLASWSAGRKAIAELEAVQPLPLEASRELAFEEIPAVTNYLARGLAACGDDPAKYAHALRKHGEHTEHGSGRRSGRAADAGAERYNRSLFEGAVIVHPKPSNGGGFGNNKLILTGMSMVAWLTERPIILVSFEGHLLRSAFLPDAAQLPATPEGGYNDFIRDVGLELADPSKLSRALRELGGRALRGGTGFCTPIWRDIFARESYQADGLRGSAQWGLPPRGKGLLLVQKLNGKTPWTSRAKACSRAFAEARGHATRVAQMGSPRHFGSCSMRFLIGHPGHTLLRFLQPIFQRLAAGVVLVAVHVRMGDGAMNEELKGKFKAKDDTGSDRRISRKSVRSYFEALRDLLRVLHRKVAPRALALFLATDAQAAAQEAAHVFHKEVFVELLQTPGVARHTGTLDMAHSADADAVTKVVADWYCLCLASALFSPVESTFSGTALHMGMHSFSVLGRAPNEDDTERMHRTPSDVFAG